MEKIAISYFSDYACPFCYIGEKNLKLAISELGLEDRFYLNMLSFELHPDAPDEYMGDPVELIAKKYSISIDQAKLSLDRIVQMGKYAEIDFDIDNTKYTNTFKAHRLTKYLQKNYDNSIVNKLIDSIFEAFFEKGKYINSDETLLSIIDDLKLDHENAKKVLESDLFTNEVRNDERIASQNGINAVPYFIFADRFIVPGAVGKDDMKEVIKKLLSELDDTIDLDAVSCGPEGCN